MAQISNPRKQFQFTINITPGTIDPFLAQKVTIPDFEIEIAEHGDVNYLVKTGGIHKFGNVTIEKITSATNTVTDNIWEWTKMVQDVLVGGGLLPIMYKRFIQVDQF